jgi:hypothetical protein
VAEAMVGDAPGAGLREQPSVGDAEKPAGGLGVDQRAEGVRLADAAAAAQQTSGA